MTLSNPIQFIRDRLDAPHAVVLEALPFWRTSRDMLVRLEPGKVARWYRVFDSGHVKELGTGRPEMDTING